MSSSVSIVFQNTEDTRAIVSAILADNPQATAAYYPAMVKIDCPGRVQVRRETVSERIGRDFDLQELHVNLINISGNIDEDDDCLTLSWHFQGNSE